MIITLSHDGKDRLNWTLIYEIRFIVVWNSTFVRAHVRTRLFLATISARKIRRSVCVSKILWNSSKCVSKILWNSSKCVRRNKRNVLRSQCSDTNRNIKWLQCAADTDSELKSNVSSVGPSSELETYSRLTILHYDSFWRRAYKRSKR